MLPTGTIFRGLSAGLFVTATLVAQTTGTPTTGGGTAGGTTGSTPGTGTTTPRPGTGIPTTTQPGNTTNTRSPFPDETRRPIFINGKVMMEDGTAPPESVLIERVCGAVPKPEGYTDTKGRFSFELGRNNAVFADASSSGRGFDSDSSGSSTSSSSPFGGGVTERSLMNCELRAALPGFRSSVVILAGRRMLDSPDVGTILLKRMANVEGFTYSATTLMAPKEAKKAFDKGLELVKKKKQTEALKEFEKATEAYPKFAAAWYELGHLQDLQENKEEAKKSYQQSLAADPKFVKPYLPLTAMAVQKSDWANVAELTAKTIKLNPYEYPQAFLYNAIANLNLKNLDDAEKSALAAVKLDEKNRIPRIKYVLGIIMAQKENYTGAAENLKSYILSSPAGTDLTTARKQLSEIEQLAGVVKPPTEPQP